VGLDSRWDVPNRPSHGTRTIGARRSETSRRTQRSICPHSIRPAYIQCEKAYDPFAVLQWIDVNSISVPALFFLLIPRDGVRHAKSKNFKSIMSIALKKSGGRERGSRQPFFQRNLMSDYDP